MATITTGRSTSWSLPGIPWSKMATAIHAACVTEPVHHQAYSEICNITWKGSTRPMILFATRRMTSVWAQCKVNGWGRGIIYVTNYPPLVERMKAWSDQTWMSGFWYHELGHILANTWTQAIGYPPQAWLVSRLQAHWGKSKVKDEADKLLDRWQGQVAIEFPPNAEPSLWDRVRMLMHPGIGLTEVNGEVV